MEQNEIDEILEHINPDSLRNCSVEELISIVNHGLDTGKLKI